MKIPLLTSLNKEELTYLNNALIISTPRKIISTEFIVDTGSPETILGYNDAMRLQIPFNSLSKSHIVELGGRKYQGYKWDRIIFKFYSDEGKLIAEEFPATIIRPTSQKDNIINSPTIIGMDFLKQKRYILFCDVSSDLAYLEKKESNSLQNK